MKPYNEFINSKQFAVSASGFDVERAGLLPTLFDFQKDIVKWSVKKGNAAIWERPGLGKTPQQLEWARIIHEETQRPVMILAPLAVSQQTKREGEKFGIHVNICKTQSDVIPGVNITNYDRAEKFDLSVFSGIVLDESSILKNYMGKIKRYLIDSTQTVQYKLSCTATPAPNDHMELLNQSEFLGIMKSNMALAIWFINKTNELGGYRLKKHAEQSFWEWISSWAVYIGQPSDLGYDNGGFDLPPLTVIDHELPISEFDLTSGDGSFLREISLNATAYNREKKHTLIPRCKRTAQIIHEYPGRQFVIWTERNDEGEYLRKLIPNAVEVKGSDHTDAKEQAAIDFVKGNIDILISKPSIFGYGLNFQNCADTIFCGLSFSYENYYQAICRFWRFMQTNPVTAHIVYGSTEKGILQVIREKEEKYHQLQHSMFGKLKDIQSINFFNRTFKTDYAHNDEIKLPGWLLNN